MFERPRPPLELRVYQCLKGRRNFSKEESATFYRLKKGFEGENYFARRIRKEITTPHLALYGLQFEIKGTSHQPDCILLLPDQFHLVEIKNFEGEFILQPDYLVSHTNNKKYRNPVHQLQRCHLDLGDMLLQLQIPLQIRPFVSFVNDSFTLFHAKPNETIILPTQLKDYFQRLNNIPGELPQIYDQYRKNLVKSNTSHSPHTRIPPYTYEKLRKGVLCHACRQPMEKNKWKAFCTFCKRYESIDSFTMRMVLEFHTLFPASEINAGAIHCWIGGIFTKQTITQRLKKYMKPVGKGRNTHYVFYSRNV